MILATTGTQLGPRIRQGDAFRRFIRRFRPDGFVHGGARGWDTIAHHAVYQAYPDMPFEIFPATEDGSMWNNIGWPGMFMMRAPVPALERNPLIVEAAHWLLAVPAQDREDDSGTWHTIRCARARGVPVYVILSDGRIVNSN